MQVSKLHNIYKLLIVLFVGFAGGFISPAFSNLFGSVKIDQAADALSIANTYIVFTTIIFVGFTVVLGVAGYVFTQQFSASKESQVKHLINELEERLRTNQDFGIGFIEKAVDNPDVIRHISCKLEDKIKELLKEKSNNKKQAATQAKNEADNLEELAAQIEG